MEEQGVETPKEMLAIEDGSQNEEHSNPSPAQLEVKEEPNEEEEEVNHHHHHQDDHHDEKPKLPPNKRQTMFAWALMDVLMYVTVINLFVEYVPQMTIHQYSFTISLVTAVVLKLVLEGVHFLQHAFQHLFCGPTKQMASKLLGAFMIWLVLFGSKFVILWIDETIKFCKNGSIWVASNSSWYCRSYSWWWKNYCGSGGPNWHKRNDG